MINITTAYPYLFCKSPKSCSSFPSTLLYHSAAKNAGNSLNTSIHATEDCGKLKQGYLDPPLNLQLEFFDTDRHIGHSFNPILWTVSPQFPYHRNDSFLVVLFYPTDIIDGNVSKLFVILLSVLFTPSFRFSLRMLVL